MSAASITIDDICRKWLANNGKHQNNYYKIVGFACDCAENIALRRHDSSSPLIKNVLLKRESTDLYFTLPKDFSGDYLTVGVRQAGRFQPVTVSQRMIPFFNTAPQAAGNFSDEYNQDDFDVYGEWLNWVTGGECTHEHTYGYSYKLDGHIVFNTAKGIVLCAPGFHATELYLSYTTLSGVDTATEISRKAKESVLAYMDWQYQKRKRNPPLGVVKELEDAYYRQIRLLRASNNTLNAQFFYDIHASPVWLGYGRHSPLPLPLSGGSSYKQETFYGVGTYFKLFKVGNPPGPAPTHNYVTILPGDPIFDPAFANVDIQTVTVAGQQVFTYVYDPVGALTFTPPVTDAYVGVWYMTLAYPKLPRPHLQIQGDTIVSATLYWDVVPGATTYNLYKRATPDFYGADLIYSGPNLTYTDNQFTLAAPYYFLQAVNSIASSDHVGVIIIDGFHWGPWDV